MTKSDYQFRRNYGLMALVAFAILTVLLFARSFKTLKDVEHATGIITDKELRQEHRTANEHRYTFAFKLDNVPQYLGIFLGSGDNAIKEGNYYDNLFQIGQQLTVYFDNNFVTKSENISRLILRIDYQGKTVYESTQRERLIPAFICLGFVFLFGGLLLWYRRKFNREQVSELEA